MLCRTGTFLRPRYPDGFLVDSADSTGTDVLTRWEVRSGLRTEEGRVVSEGWPDSFAVVWGMLRTGTFKGKLTLSRFCPPEERTLSWTVADLVGYEQLA